MTSERAVDTQWIAISEQLRAEVGEAAFQSWIKPITVREVEKATVRVSVPTRFMRDWVLAHYVDRLAELWCAHDEGITDVDVSVQPERYSSSKPEPGKPCRDYAGPMRRASD
nr:hypothetical protein [Alphaproteobacteria bacterium]